MAPGPRPAPVRPVSPVAGGSTPSVKHGGDGRGHRTGRPAARSAGAPAGASCHRRADPCCIGRVHIIIVGCGRVGSGLAIGLVEQGHSVAVIDRNPKAFRRLPRTGRDHRRRARASTGTTSTGPGPREAGGPGRRDQRRQLQHPHRPHRPRDLRDPQRGGPHLRPPPGPDLPPPGHPHRGHRGLDHRPGPPAAGPRRARRAEWSDPTGTLSLVERDLPDRLGRQAAGRPQPPRRGDAGVGDPGRRGPARRRRPGRPGRGRPPPGGRRRRPGRLGPARRGRCRRRPPAGPAPADRRSAAPTATGAGEGRHRRGRERRARPSPPTSTPAATRSSSSSRTPSWSPASGASWTSPGWWPTPAR